MTACVPSEGAGGSRKRRAIALMATAGPWVVATVVIVVAMRWGARLQVSEPDIRLGAAPLVGIDKTDGWDWRYSRMLPAAGAVALLVALAPTRSWWWRWPRPAVIAFTSVTAALFSGLLALTDGTVGILRGAEHPTEYLANLGRTPPAGAFVRGFVADMDRYTVHVRGHPPGFVLVLKLLDRLGLDGPWPVVGLSLAATALLPAAVLVTVGALGGDGWVRRCAPLLAVSPYALWQMTSADAVFSAVGAWGVAACVLGLTGPARRAIWWGAAGGGLLAGLLFLTYGGVLFLLVPAASVAVAAWQHAGRSAGRPPRWGRVAAAGRGIERRPAASAELAAEWTPAAAEGPPVEGTLLTAEAPPADLDRTAERGRVAVQAVAKTNVVAVVAGAVVVAAAVTAGFAAAGFWWFDGAAETRRQYWAGTARFRPVAYFALANLAVALIAIGPGGWAGLVRLWLQRRRPPPVAVVVVGALAALLAANASQYTRGEVERIWLLFYPWLVTAGGLVVSSERRWRSAALIAAQAGCGVALQAVLVSKW